MKVHTLQSTFLTGQLSDEAQARAETALYKNGAAELTNCLPLATGGVLSRWGSAPLAQLTSPTVLMAEFAFSAEQSYMAVFTGSQVLFFYASDGSPAGTLSGCPWSAAELRALKTAQAGDLMWCVHPDHAPRLIRRTGTASWQLETLAYESAAATPTYRYAAPGVTVEGVGGGANQLRVTAGVSGGSYLLTSGSLVRWRKTGETEWREFRIASLAETDGNGTWSVITGTWVDGLAGPPNGEASELEFRGLFTPGAWSGSVLAGTTEGGIPFQLGFSAAVLTDAHVGTVLRVRDEGLNLYRACTITSLVTATHCHVTWQDGLAITAGKPTLLWEEQAFSATRGWPRSVGFHQQRLVLGGGRDVGDALWLSRTGRYWNFDLGTARDDEAIALSLGVTRARAIRHVLSAEGLMLLTERGTYWIPPDAQKPLTPATASVKLVAEHGSSEIPPCYFDGGAIIVGVTGTAVRDFAPADGGEVQRIVSEPVSLVATAFMGTLTDAAYMHSSDERPEQYGFFVNAAGQLVVFHSMRAQKIGAWSLWTTQGEYKAVGVAGGRLFAVVARAANIYVERFDPTLAFDHARVLTAAAGSLSHPGYAAFAGFTVHGRSGDDYLGDGIMGGGGLVELTRTDLVDGQFVEVGLAFDWRITPLPPAVELPDGSMLRRTQRTLRTHMRLVGAQSCQMGAESLLLLVDGFDPALPPAPQSRWWRATHLGFQRSQPIDGGQSGERVISRTVPLPVGVLAVKREVIV